MMRLRVPEGKSYEIKGRTYKSGEEFDAPDKEAALWKATGLAEDAPPLPLKRGPGRPRKDETAAAAFYDRKDMRAEEGSDE